MAAATENFLNDNHFPAPDEYTTDLDDCYSEIASPD